MTSVSLHNVTVSYRRRPAIHHVSAEFPAGQASAIFGPNGAGKSTILKTLMGFLQPETGEVELAGCRLTDIAYMPQAAQIDRSLPVTVLDTVLTGCWRETGVLGGVTRAGLARARQALADVGLFGFEARAISELSGGQFQRVLFARIQMQDARLILLDEPFASVDAKTTFDLLAFVRRWEQEGRTVIAVLHDYEQVRAWFGRTLLLAREVIACGATEDVLTESNLARANRIATHWQAHPPVCDVPAGEAQA